MSISVLIELGSTTLKWSAAEVVDVARVGCSRAIAPNPLVRLGTLQGAWASGPKVEPRQDLTWHAAPLKIVFLPKPSCPGRRIAQLTNGWLVGRGARSVVFP